MNAEQNSKKTKLSIVNEIDIGYIRFSAGKEIKGLLLKPFPLYGNMN